MHKVTSTSSAAYIMPNHTHIPSLIADVTAYDIISDINHAHWPPGCIMSLPLPTISHQTTPIPTPGCDVT